jgi:RNA polymerase sigma factor (sigma-70 family)
MLSLAYPAAGVHNSIEMAPSDSELLEEFVRRKSDAAFGQIVGRYSNLVFAAARRQVGDPHRAEDVTQAAFIVLARKAASVRGDNLAGWLLATTRLCALDAIKKQTRRAHYEREAAMAKSEVGQPSEIPDPQITAWLDGAMMKLSRRACTALALRYLQDKPVNEVAAALKTSPNAAQKILARSLVKLRKILGRRGVIVPSTAILSAALLHESAQTAPASLVISSSSAAASSVSIVKGVCQMMFWTKIKIGAAIAAATTLLAGTGSFVLMEALAQTPAPPAAVSDAPAALDVAPGPASVAPFESPFLELVGCRIKQSVSLKLSPDPAPQANVTWIEQQYPQVQWTVDPALMEKVNGYAISITPTNDPAGAKTVRADKSASAQPLMEELGRAGEYDVKVSSLGADSQALASAAVHVVVNPLPSTQITISDVQPDGTIAFTFVGQELNISGRAVTDYRFINSDFVHVTRMTDEQGTPLQFTTRHQGDIYQYRCVFRKPVPVGEAQLLSNSGTETGLVAKLGGGVFLYGMTHTPGGGSPVRRIELYRLPEGAKLIYKSANLVSREVDGRTQMFMDVMIPQGGSNSVSFRYRLAGN